MIRQWLGVGAVWGVVLLRAPLPAGAADVCALSGAALNTEVEAGAAEIAKAYATAKSQLSLSGGPCNWTCGRGTPITQLIKAFGFLQYNCSNTTAPSSTRRPTGRDTNSEMGLFITDLEYRAAADKILRSGSTGVGDLMRVPSSLELASRDGDLKKLTDAVEKIHGAAWMKFSSTSVDNPPDGAARVIIRVPDSQDPPRFEQWIQIAISQSTGALGRNVDFLAVQLRGDDPPMVAFRGYSRTDKGFVPEGPGSNPPEHLTKCYSCHPSGVRTVIPAPAGTRAADGQPAIKPAGTIPSTGPGSIDDITNDPSKRLAVFGPSGYTVSQNGPPLGPSTRPTRAQFVANGCAASLKTRQAAIVANMDCQKCHDGETDRGILNAGTSVRTIRHKVVENTVAPMPPPVVWEKDPSLKLSPSEREILFQCLQAEYAEILRQWLTSDLLMVP